MAAHTIPSLPYALAALRDASWLNAARATAYVRLLACLSLAGAAVWVALSRSGLDLMGKPLGSDFLCFWSASKLALDGHATAVYAPEAHAAAERAVFSGATVAYTAFFYPPVFLLLSLPLALLPYMASLGAWIGVTGLAFWHVARAWLDRRVGMLPVLAFPAVFVTVAHGQNAFLTTALLGFGALTLSAQPVLAGACFGLLVFKPHLALLIPVVLIAGCHWRATTSAICTALAVTLLSLLVFGPAVWADFFAMSRLARSALELGWLGSAKMQSSFAAVRLLGGPVSLAYGIQALVSLATAVTLFTLVRRCPEDRACGAALLSGALLTTPYLFDYDLTLSAIPLCWLLSEGLANGFRPWERTAIALTYMLPLLSRTMAGQIGVPVAPLILAALFVLVVRRAFGVKATGSRALA